MKNSSLIYQYDLHHKLFHNVLNGFSDSESNKRLHGDANMNHVKYLAGHLLNSHYGLAKIAGLQPSVKWHDLFAVMGQSEARDDITYPHLKEIKQEWNELHEVARNQLNSLTPEDLSKPPPAPFDKIGNSVSGVWAFINHHIAYHIGQIGILRRGFGKEPMKYD